MAFCPKCGTEVQEGARFCPSCGTQVRVKSPARPAPDDPYLGQLLDKKYHIDELLGVGGMGRVYKATQLALDKLVCVKVLRSGMMQDDTLVGRFHREARAASRLNHPNSIAVTDFGQAQEDGSLYMVMEYVPGKDLGKVIREERPIAEKRIIHIMDQVLSALADAHAAGIIHRDLKPENIMVTDLRGTKDFVKVLDFGIAKIQETSPAEPGLTQAGMVCGTPEYMSPEQARGEELDARSDVYAAGVILYQMVVGRIPFNAPTAMGIVTKHLTEAPVPPSRMDGIKISPALETVILKAMSKDRAGRPATALALQQELNQVLHQKTAYAQQTPLGTSLFDEETGTHVPAPVTPEAMKETKDSVPAMRAKRGSKAWLVALIVVLLVAGGAAAGYFLWWLPRQQAGDDVPVASVDAGAVVVTQEPKIPEKDAGVEVAAADVPKVEEIPEAAKIHYAAGKEFMAQQKIEKAIAAFKKAVKKAPDFAKAYRALGTCHMRLGQIKAAKKFFRLYLEKAPEDAEDRADIRELIDSL
jgi:serine/threonine protein kinase